ncbi:hypothetical protein OC844_005211 [Tilletia horrida]|nr:hypothetical protein OC844_005211 [Tilletia horrida]
MAATADLQDGSSFQDVDDTRDTSDARSISSDPDEPSLDWAYNVGLPWYLFNTLPEAAPLSEQVKQMQPVLHSSCVLLMDSVSEVMMLARLTLEHKLLRRDATALCARILGFYDELSRSGLASAAAAPPGTVVHFLLKLLHSRVTALENCLSQYLQGFKPLTIADRRLWLTLAREQITRAQTEFRIFISEARRTLGLVTKPHRVAFRYLYLPDTHPFVHSSLLTAFDDKLQSLDSAFRSSEATFARKPSFPDVAFHSRLLICLRNIAIRRPYPPEELVSRHEGSSSSTDEANHDNELEEDERSAEDDVVDGAEDDNQSDFQGTVESEDEIHFDPEDCLDYVLQELLPHRLAFANLEELDRWRRLALARTRDIAFLQHRGWDLLNESNPHQLLAMLIIETCKMECFDDAAIFAELFVIHYRFQLAQEPGNDFKKGDLCMALALLSVVLSRCNSRRPEGVQAIEEAQSLLSTLDQAPLKEGQFEAMSATFAVFRGHALHNEKRNEGIGHRPLWDVRKAFRSARAGLEGLQAFHAKHPTNKMLLAAVGRAAYSAAAIGLHLLRVIEGQQDAHKLCIEKLRLKVERPLFRQQRPYPPFEFYESWCADSLEQAEQAYIHGKMGDLTLGSVDDFAQFARIAVDAFRVLSTEAEEESSSDTRLYEPLLAKALLLRAELLDLRPTEAIAVAEEAVELYIRLSLRFPAHFDNALLRLYRDHLARHLYLQNDMVQASSTLALAIEFQARQVGQHDASVVARDVAALRTTRAVVCVHLERYDVALTELSAAQTLVDGEREERRRFDATHAKRTLRLHAVRAFCLWMTGQSQLALVELEDVGALLEARVEKSKTMRFEYVPARDPDAILFRGWLGAVRAVVGDAELGKREVGEAVRQARELGELDLREDVRAELVLKEALVPLPRILTHLLVLHAGILAQVGEEHKAESTGCVEEALALSGEDFTACDLSTLKTALMLKRRLLKSDVLPFNEEEAEKGEEERDQAEPAAKSDDDEDGDTAAAGTRAGRPGLQGFLAQLTFARPSPAVVTMGQLPTLLDTGQAWISMS